MTKTFESFVITHHDLKSNNCKIFTCNSDLRIDFMQLKQCNKNSNYNLCNSKSLYATQTIQTQFLQPNILQLKH